MYNCVNQSIFNLIGKTNTSRTYQINSKSFMLNICHKPGSLPVSLGNARSKAASESGLLMPADAVTDVSWLTLLFNI